MRDSIPSVKWIVDTANINENDVTGLSTSYDQIYKYYRNRTDIEPARYSVSSDNNSYEARSLLYIPDKDIDESDTVDTGINYSNYSSGALDIVDLDTDNFWNGELALVVYEDDTVKFGQTDYYTYSTYSRLLRMESQHSKSVSDMRLRDETLSTEEHLFDTPFLSAGASAGGVILGRRNGEWKMLLGRRSEDSTAGSGRVSIIPNGGVHYSDLNSGGFVDTAVREFVEEVSPYDDMERTKQSIQVDHTVNGWNLASGQLSVNYTFVVDDDLYENIYENDTTNFEFSEIIEVDIQDIESVQQFVQMDYMSPSVVPVVYETLQHFDNEDDLPTLPYDIKRI